MNPRRIGSRVRRLGGAAIVAAAAAHLAGCDRSSPSGEAVGPPSKEQAQVAPPEAAPPVELVELDGVTAGGTYRVRVRSGPEGVPALEPFSLEVEIEGGGGVPLQDGALVLVDAAMPHHGHGMNFVPEITRVGPGRYAVEGMLFHMRGRWELFVDVERDGVRERAQWTVVLE